MVYLFDIFRSKQTAEGKFIFHDEFNSPMLLICKEIPYIP